MTLFRSLFPSFEKPAARPHYVNLEPQSHEFSGVGIVLLLAASCGVALALWEPSHQVTTPFVTASVPRSAPAATAKPSSREATAKPASQETAVKAASTEITARPATQETAATAASPETTAAADASEDDQLAPTVKLSTLCAQKSTARRDCASVKALKDARLKAPDPAPLDPTSAAAKASKPAVAAAKAPNRDQAAAPAVTQQAATPTATRQAAAPTVTQETAPPAATQQAAAPPATRQASAVTPPQAPAQSSAAPLETPAVTQPEAPAAQPQKTAAAPKAKRQRGVPEDVERAVREAPIERLVKVYEQVTPDGRRVPVYRRVGSGSYETGVIVDGEYRPARRVEAGTRYFGLQ